MALLQGSLLKSSICLVVNMDSGPCVPNPNIQRRLDSKAPGAGSSDPSRAGCLPPPCFHSLPSFPSQVYS